MITTEIYKLFSRIKKHSEMRFKDIDSDIYEKLKSISLSGSHRRFFVSRLGSTGSTWLAKLLNSHPEVFCEHEGILKKIYPRKDFGPEDITEFILTVAHNTHHNAYKAAGDVGSVSLTHAIRLPEGLITTALLIRHPARMLFTKISNIHPETLSEFKKNLNKPNEIIVQEALKKEWGIDDSRFEDMDRIFLRNAYRWVAQLKRAQKFNLLIIKIEDMNEVNYASDILLKLTGVEYEKSLIERMANKRENVRAKKFESINDLMKEFHTQQCEWYKLMVYEEAEKIGYSH